MATRSTEREAAREPRGREPERGETARRAGAALDPRLEAELAAGPWDHAWPLAPSVETRARTPWARQELWTLERFIETFVRDELALATERTAIDLRCGEGWMAHRLLAWGARRVVACDDRPERLYRARLIRDHYAIPGAELELRSIRDQPLAELDETFDLVLLLGADDPLPGDAGLIATARSLARRGLAVECHATETVAVAEEAIAAGFASVERMSPPLQAAPRYLLGDRELLLARVEGP